MGEFVELFHINKLKVSSEHRHAQKETGGPPEPPGQSKFQRSRSAKFAMTTPPVYWQDRNFL